MAHETLTERQETFCRHLAADLTNNGTAAAKAAGCPEKSAHVTASKWLRLAKVQARLAELRGKSEERVLAATLKADEYAVLDNIQDYVLKRLVDNVERAMVAEPVKDREGNLTGEYVYNGAVANGALKLLGMTKGMFKEVKETKEASLADALKTIRERRRLQRQGAA